MNRRHSIGSTALLIGGLLASLACFKSHQEFQVEGTITISPALQREMPERGVSLFIIAKDEGGVPVAVKRIVNPQFPLSYSLGPDDLLMPSMEPKGLFRIELELNSHGRIGSPRPGDFGGFSKESVASPARDLALVIDRKI